MPPGRVCVLNNSASCHEGHWENCSVARPRVCNLGTSGSWMVNLSIARWIGSWAGQACFVIRPPTVIPGHLLTRSILTYPAVRLKVVVGFSVHVFCNVQITWEVHCFALLWHIESVWLHISKFCPNMLSFPSYSAFVYSVVHENVYLCPSHKFYFSYCYSGVVSFTHAIIRRNTRPWKKICRCAR